MKKYALALDSGSLFLKATVLLKPNTEIVLKREDVLNQKSQVFKKVFGKKGMFGKPKEEVEISIRESTSGRSFGEETFEAYTAFVKPLKKLP